MFEGDYAIQYQLAPPMVSRVGVNGRPAKTQFLGLGFTK